jgi:SnoaL-like domain
MSASADLAALSTAYFAATDALDHAQWASLFTSDGSFTAVYRLGEEPFFVAKGHDQLRSVLVNNEQFPRTFHMMGNHSFAVDGESATGTVYCMAHHLLPGDPAANSLVMLIRYWDEYALTSNGWRFQSRCAEQSWQEIHSASLTSVAIDDDGRLRIAL